MRLDWALISWLGGKERRALLFSRDSCTKAAKASIYCTFYPQLGCASAGPPPWPRPLPGPLCACAPGPSRTKCVFLPAGRVNPAAALLRLVQERLGSGLPAWSLAHFSQVRLLTAAGHRTTEPGPPSVPNLPNLSSLLPLLLQHSPKFQPGNRPISSFVLWPFSVCCSGVLTLINQCLGLSPSHLTPSFPSL